MFCTRLGKPLQMAKGEDGSLHKLLPYETEERRRIRGYPLAFSLLLEGEGELINILSKK